MCRRSDRCAVIVLCCAAFHCSKSHYCKSYFLSSHTCSVIFSLSCFAFPLCSILCYYVLFLFCCVWLNITSHEFLVWCWWRRSQCAKWRQWRTPSLWCTDSRTKWAHTLSWQAQVSNCLSYYMPAYLFICLDIYLSICVYVHPCI